MQEGARSGSAPVSDTPACVRSASNALGESGAEIILGSALRAADPFGSSVTEHPQARLSASDLFDRIVSSSPQESLFTDVVSRVRRP